jgi:hypothetical protein
MKLEGWEVLDLTEKICLIVETSLGKLPIFLLSRAY